MAKKNPFATETKGGLTAVAYPGAGSVLLAFDLDGQPDKDFAGFAVSNKPPGGKSEYLVNRLHFDSTITADTKAKDRRYYPTNEAPYQKFRWVHFPKNASSKGEFTYGVTAMHFKPGSKTNELLAGDKVSLKFPMAPTDYKNFEFAFTRGYLSSQAYAEQFGNAEFRPKGAKSIDYNTKPFEKQYKWLGFEARVKLFEFLDEAVKNPDMTLDLFAYDLDEPDVIKKLAALKHRLRAFLDNAPLHIAPNAAEPMAKAKLIKSAGEKNVKVGHFKRFAHCKVFILKKNGKPVKVLAGSMNFSVRGMYVQANNIYVFHEPKVAAMFEQAFEQAFNDPSKGQTAFAKSEVANTIFDIGFPHGPNAKLAFSPHTSAGLSLGPVAEALKTADSSVMFAIMAPQGTGPVLEAIKGLSRHKVYTMGVTDTMGGDASFYPPGSTRAVSLPFSYLKDKIPPPFQQEYSGGMGRVVHHKFIAIDFNSLNPVIITGSSNLAAGGEQANGDQLIMIYDRGVATAFGVEAVRLLDHYHFRAAMKKASKVNPLNLVGAGEKPLWWKGYWDKKDIKFGERQLFGKPPVK
jgi:hypothetical protein